MNACNGNGNCSNQTGSCTCNVGWTGADCSAKVYNLENNMLKKINSNGLKWEYF